MIPNRTRAKQIICGIHDLEMLPGISFGWFCVECKNAPYEAVRELDIERMRLQQEINCLRMAPCQLPSCMDVHDRGTLKGLEMAACISEDYFERKKMEGGAFRALDVRDEIRAKAKELGEINK